MEFGVTGVCFTEYPWKDFLQAAVRLGVEAVELDVSDTAHCSTWTTELEPAPLVEDLKSAGLRAAAMGVPVDLVHADDAGIEAAAATVRAGMDLAFGYRSEVIRIPPQRMKPGVSREAALESIKKTCGACLEQAEENGMLICLAPDPDILNDLDAFSSVLDSTDSYNLKATLDPLELLRGSRDPEAVRTAIAGLIERTAHVVVRDGKINPETGVVTEVPIGQGDCPVEMVVSEAMGVDFYRPFFVEYRGSGDVYESIKEGVDFFRDLPNRLLAEAGIL
ncbi:MAG TPA: sugar phosphate isomerase/epimerase [Armatimonadota bacterium]|nr:sugar phosphate isomerase/epimerase [Armatimonadota bacterium]